MFPLTTIQTGDRSCGDCTACCTAVGVSEMGKPIWTPCVHTHQHGCGIYKDRPDSCRTFYCLWQAGFLDGDERRRPDRLGIMFTAPDHKTFDRIIGAWEIRPGALKEPAVQYLLARIAEKFVIWIYPHNEPHRRRIMGRSDLIAQIDQIQECN